MTYSTFQKCIYEIDVYWGIILLHLLYQNLHIPKMATWAITGSGTMHSGYPNIGSMDPTETKNAITKKLEQEEESVKWLLERTQQSEELTNGMVSILTSFEDRLSKLEATILPVYLETENLQRRQENIDRTLEAMDHVIGFYNVSKETETTVRAGPSGGAPTIDGNNADGGGSGQLDTFLQAMSRLKGALNYFERHNPQSIELENVRKQYEEGGDALSREFSELIRKYSRPVPAVDILNAISGDPANAAAGITDPSDSAQGHHRSKSLGDGGGIVDREGAGSGASIHHFPEDVQTNLIAIAEWLNLNDREEFMNVYASVRGSVLKKSLDRLRDHQKSASGGGYTSGATGSARLRSPSPGSINAGSAVLASAVGRKVSNTPGLLGVDGTPTSTGMSSKRPSRLQRSIISQMKKVENSTGINLTGTDLGSARVGRRSVGTPSLVTEEQLHGELEAESFCLQASALQRLMAAEKVLMVGIIPHAYQRKMFEIITRESIDALVKDGDAITQRVKRAAGNNDFLTLMTVFQVVRHLSQLKPAMDRTLEGSDATLRTKYNGMVHSLFTAGSTALDGFIDNIRADATSREKMPKDGTVFQLTSNVILFLEQLLDYVETISAVLTQDTSYNQTLLRLPRKISVSERGHALVGIYIKKVLVQLNLTLVNKSDSYHDHFLKAVFRLNNNQYILKSVQRSGLLEVVKLAEPDCEENYLDMILEQKRLYSQSWARVLGFIWSADDIPVAILQAPGKLGDRYCRTIKEKFAGFNKEIEEISSTQKSYSIPDVELRESLKRDNKEYICPKYNSFYEKYANVQFTKNPEKYVRYTPAQVSSLIDSFFDAAA